MSTDTEACLAWLHRNCFKEIIQIESTLEEYKLALASQQDFNLSETFAIFAPNQMARLSHYEIEQGLTKLGVKAEDSDIVLLSERYDAD